MLCKTEWSWELWTWSHQMNLLDILSTSPHYFYRKWIGEQMRIQILILGFKGLKVILPKRGKILLHSKSRNFTGVCMVGGKNFPPPPPPTLQLLNTTTLRSYICVSFQQIAFLIGSFTDHNAFFPVVLTDFSLTGRRQKSK